MITFKIDTSDLDEKLERLSEIDKFKIHDGIGYIIENKVVENIDRMGLVDSGQFRNSIHHVTRPDYVLIQDNVDYGIHLEYGTRPHVILPTKKKALAWGANIGISKKGQVMKEHVAKKVMHPGTKEYAPFRKALIDSQEEVTKYARDKIVEYANKSK